MSGISNIVYMKLMGKSLFNIPSCITYHFHIDEDSYKLVGLDSSDL